MINKGSFFGKILLAQLVSFVIASYMTNNYFVSPTIALKPDVMQRLQQLPQQTIASLASAPNKITTTISKFSSGQNLAPPWVNKTVGQEKSNRIVFRGPTPILQNEPIVSAPPQNPTVPPINLPSILPLPTFPPLPTFAPLPTFIAKLPGSERSPTMSVPTVSPIPQISSSQLENEIINLINSRRKADGLGGLTANTQLTAAARRHSADISAHNNCGHYGSDGSDPFVRARQAGYTGSVHGETVACRHRTPESAVAGWWSSPPHHAILTNSTIKQIGVGWAGNYQTAIVGY